MSKNKSKPLGALALLLSLLFGMSLPVTQSYAAEAIADSTQLLVLPSKFEQNLITNFYSIRMSSFDFPEYKSAGIVTKSSYMQGDKAFWMLGRWSGDVSLGFVSEDNAQIYLNSKVNKSFFSANAEMIFLSILEFKKALYVATWEPTYSEKGCGGIRIYKMNLDKNYNFADKKLFYSSTPCLIGWKADNPTLSLSSNGEVLFVAGGDRIFSWIDGTFPYPGHTNLEKMNKPPTSNLYGKVISLSSNGTLVKTISKGLRNTNGLFYSKFYKNLFSTDNGARGGDYISIDSPGSNFGWPKYSLGLPYGPEKNIGFTANRSGPTPPLFSWTPSISPTGIIEVTEGDKFSKYWKNDLIVGSLKDKALHRLKIVKEKDSLKVLYDERIKIGFRIRSLVYLKDLILISTDEGNLITLTEPDVNISGGTPEVP